MHYVQQSLAPDEELIHIGHFHWIYTASAVMQIVFGVFMCVAIMVVAYLVQSQLMGAQFYGIWDYITNSPVIVRLIAFFAILFGLLKFSHMMVIKATTEIAVTTSRLIHKRGLVSRSVGEIAVDRIEGVNLAQGILGRMLNFGKVIVRGMGVGEVVLPPIADPVKFRKAIEKAKMG